MLFDLEKDRSQLTDISPDQPELVARLDTAYTEWWDSVSKDFPVMKEVELEGVLEKVNPNSKVKSPGVNYLLKSKSGKEITMKQPSPHLGSGWTPDLVPELAPFAGRVVTIRALVCEYPGGKNPEVWRITGIQSARKKTSE